MKKVLNKEVFNFIENNPFDVNDTHGWVGFVKKIITTFELESRVFENEEGYGISINSFEEKDFIENVLYDVEETETTLNYIFEGNIKYLD